MSDMAKLDRKMLFNILLVVLCLFLSVDQFLELDGTEFSGGLLTGKLLYMNLIGAVFFACALGAALFTISGKNIFIITGAILCIPLQIFAIYPGIFYSFYDEYSFSVARSDFNINKNAIVILVLMVLAIVSGVNTMVSNKIKR